MYIHYIAKKRGFPPNYKIERVEKMSVKRAFFGIFQKLVVFCCAIFFGFANAFSANLPSGYTELEYIQSSGTQYIDTDIYFDFAKNFKVNGRFYNPDASKRKIILGNYSGSGVLNIELKADPAYLELILLLQLRLMQLLMLLCLLMNWSHIMLIMMQYHINLRRL